MIELVERCLDRDDEAWGDLLLLGERVGLRAIRRVLRKYRLAEMEYDVLQEIYLRLLDDDMRRLRTFRGTTELQFELWFCRVALNAARDWAKRELARLKGTESLVEVSDVVESRGPTIGQLSSLLDDLAAMLKCGIKQLRIMCGLATALGVPERTLRNCRQAASR